LPILSKCLIEWNALTGSVIETNKSGSRNNPDYCCLLELAQQNSLFALFMPIFIANLHYPKIKAIRKSTMDFQIAFPASDPFNFGGFVYS
jgi:hypothetical protein